MRGWVNVEICIKELLGPLTDLPMDGCPVDAGSISAQSWRSLFPNLCAFSEKSKVSHLPFEEGQLGLLDQTREAHCTGPRGRKGVSFSHHNFDRDFNRRQPVRRKGFGQHGSDGKNTSNPLDEALCLPNWFALHPRKAESSIRLSACLIILAGNTMIAV